MAIVPRESALHLSSAAVRLSRLSSPSETGVCVGHINHNLTSPDLTPMSDLEILSAPTSVVHSVQNRTRQQLWLPQPSPDASKRRRRD